MDGYGIQVNRQRDRRFVPLPESLQGGDWEEITPGEQLEAKPAIAPPAKQWSEISPGEYDHIVNPPEETPWTQRPIPVLGNVEEMLTLPKGIVHGTQQLAAGAGAGMQWLGNRLDSKLITEAGKKVSDYYQKQAKAMGPPKSIAGKNLWDNPELLINPSYWIYNIADMAPSLAAAMIPAMGAAKAIQIGGQAIRLSPQVIARLSSLGAAATGGAVGGAMEGSQTYQTVLGEGGSEEEAARAGELMTVLAGTLNAVGMGNILSRAGNDFKGKVVKRLGAGVWEGLTEAAEEPAEVTSRLLAKYLEGEELPKEIGPMFVDSLKQAITVFPVAGITGGTATFAGPKGAPAPEKEILGWEMVPEEEEPIDLVDVVEPEDKKLLNAIKTEVRKGNLTVDQVETLREQAKERYPDSKEIHEEFDKLIAKMGQVETPGEREGLVPVAVTGELAKKPAKESAEVFEKELAEEEELRRSERGGRLLKEQLAGEEAMEIAAEAEGAIKPIPYEELYPEEEGWEEISEEEISEEAAPEKPTLEGELEEITEDELDDLITEAAEEAETEPTEAQIEAGNYKKGHIRLYGLDISIENPKGSTRKGVDRKGKPWETTMKYPYGYIRGTQGKDKDHLDVFLGPNAASDNVYVVDQVDPKTKVLDEHKILLGWNNIESARDGYLSNYEEGWQGIGSIIPINIKYFKSWLNKGNKKKSFAGSPWGKVARKNAFLQEDLSNRRGLNANLPSDLSERNARTVETESLLEVPTKMAPSQVLSSQVSTIKDFKDSSGRYIEKPSDFVEGPPLSSQKKGLIDRPREAPSAMQEGVFGLSKNFEVIDGIIQAVPVDVMDNLVRPKPSSKELLHDEAMFKNLPPVSSYQTVGSRSTVKKPDMTSGIQPAHIIPPFEESTRRIPAESQEVKKKPSPLEAKALAEQKARKARDKQAESQKYLVPWIAASGGIQPKILTGEIKDIIWTVDAKGKKRLMKGIPPGFMSGRGRSLDVIVRDAQEAGFDVRDEDRLLELIEKDLTAAGKGDIRNRITRLSEVAEISEDDFINGVIEHERENLRNKGYSEERIRALEEGLEDEIPSEIDPEEEADLDTAYQELKSFFGEVGVQSAEPAEKPTKEFTDKQILDARKTVAVEKAERQKLAEELGFPQGTPYTLIEKMAETPTSKEKSQQSLITEEAPFELTREEAPPKTLGPQHKKAVFPTEARKVATTGTPRSLFPEEIPETKKGETFNLEELIEKKTPPKVEEPSTEYPKSATIPPVTEKPGKAAEPTEETPKAEGGVEYNKRAIRKYGTTTIPESMGFITREGKAIDSSGIKQGSRSQGRNIDHREIAQEALGDVAKADSWSASMHQFMEETGDIRVVGAKDEFNIDVPIIKGMPSDKQLALLRKISSGKKIYYDFTGKNGNIVKSGEGLYSDFLRDLKQSVKGEREISESLAQGKVPKQLKPLEDFIREHGLTKNEVVDARFNRDNPLYNDFRKAMDKTTVGVTKLWSDFGFKNVEDFYNKVIKPSPKPSRPPEVGGAIGEPVTYDVTGKIEQPKTPYKVSEEAQDLLDDIRQPDRDTLSTAGGALGRVEAGAGVKTLASALKEEATQTGRIDLRGKVVRTPEDLAVLAQVYRNPRFETLRIFYVKDNIIVAHEGITSRMPHFSAAFTKRPQYDLYKMRDRMKRLGADGYYLLHNHPKGDPKASDADARVTAKYASEVPGFKAHVIIDSGTYFVFGENYYQLMSNMIGYKRDLPGLPPNWKDPLIPEGIAIGGVEKINGPRDVAKMGQALKTKDDYVVLLYRGNNAKCQAIQEMPLDLFSNIKEASNYIRGRMRQLGAPQVVAYVDKPEIVTDIFGEKMPGRELIKNGTLVDVVYNLQPGKEAIAESRYPGVFTQPDMIAGIHEEDFPAIRVEESRVIEDVWRSGTERPFAFDPNSTMNEGRFRLRDPDQFDEAAYTIKDKPTKFISRSKKNDIQEEGIRFIVGKVDGEEQIQAIRFNKNIWPEEKAAEWWEENRETFKPEWKTKTEVAKALDEKEWANKWIDNILKKAEEEEKKKAEIQDKETITQAKRIRKEQDYFEKDYPEDTKTTAREVITHIKKRKNFDWEEGKPDTSVLERLIASPEFYFEKVPAAWKVFEAGLNRTDEYFMNFNQMTMEEGESLLGKIKQLQKDRSIEYRKLKNLITYADRNKITYTEEGLRDKGFSDQAVEAWKSYRRIMDNGFDALFAEMRDIIEKHEAAGIPLPQVVTHVAGKRVQVDLKTALAQMGSMRGYYAPRARRAGKYMLVAKKEGVSPILEFYDIKITPAAPMQIRAKKLRSQGYHVTLSKAKTMPEDVFQLAGKTIGLQSMINTALDRIKKDTPATLEDYGLTGEMKERDYLLRGPFNPAMTKAFKMLGGKWVTYPAGEPRAWHFMDPPKDIERRIINALGGIEETALDTETAFAFSLATELANIVKGRGFRASMIKRGAELGEEVWAGYEEDPLTAATQYASGIAAGMAKKNMSGKMMRAITGTDIPWSEFEGTYEEYMEYVKRNRIDPTTQPNIFRDATVYMEEMLRNEEFSDRVIGVIKGITVLKYLGGRLSAPLVNLTALITSVPASMNGYANIPIHKTFGLIGKAMDEYAKYRFGNREEMDPDLVRLFDHIYEKGWGTPQYNREALSVLKSKFGSGWNRVIDYAMLLFGATEHLNRVSTIAGTYIGLKEQKVRMSRENMLMTAKKTSDRAHGIYGKATIPHYAQGKNIASYAIKAFYVFSKFSHTYLQNMYQLGFKQGNKKALTYMMLAPAIISGYAAAPIVVEVLNIALSRLLGVDDPEEDFYSWLGENLGELASDFARFGLFGVLLGVSLKGSLRIDMHRGIPTTLPELVGAPGNVLTDIWHGGKDIIKGRPYRGIEKLAPRMVGQPMQAIREYREGVTTRLGVPKYLGKERMEPSMVDSVLKFLTFNPAGIAKQKEQKWSETKKVQKYQGMRTEIYALIRDYYNKPASQRSKARWAEIMLKVDDYNDRVSEKDLVGIRGLSLITRESIRTALRQYR